MCAYAGGMDERRVIIKSKPSSHPIALGGDDDDLATRTERPVERGPKGPHQLARISLSTGEPDGNHSGLDRPAREDSVSGIVTAPNRRATRSMIFRDDPEAKSWEQIAYGEVYIPERVETYGTTMTAEEVRRVAHDFLARGLSGNIDEMHDQVFDKGHVIESFIARAGDPDGFIEGSWVLGVRVTDSEVWDKIVRGEYNGFSIYGYANRETALVELSHVTEVDLDTEASTDGPIPPHSHGLHILFDDSSTPIPTWTGRTLDHVHRVVGTTATEMEIDHAHRFVVVE
jgi:hypothetical protein